MRSARAVAFLERRAPVWLTGIHESAHRPRELDKGRSAVGTGPVRAASRRSARIALQTTCPAPGRVHRKCVNLEA